MISKLNMKPKSKVSNMFIYSIISIISVIVIAIVLVLVLVVFKKKKQLKPKLAPGEIPNKPESGAIDFNNGLKKCPYNVWDNTQNFKQFKRIYNSTWRGKVNNRAVFFIKPKSPLPDGEKYPVLLYFSFLNQDGTYQGWENATNCSGGVASNYGHLDDRLIILFNTLNKIVKQGVAVIMVSMYTWDSMFYRDCKNIPPGVDETHYKNDVNNICWNNGDNPDRIFFDKLFLDLKGNSNLNNFDYNNIGLLGYSVGTHMVSRCINEFDSLTIKAKAKTNIIPYPSIKYGIMIGGGSYYCYDYGNNGDYSKGKEDINPFTDGDYMNKDPWKCDDNNLDCFNNLSKGTCPINMIEETYDNNLDKIKTHPAVLLLQTKDDNGADSLASTKYYNYLKKNGFNKVYKNTFTDSSNCKGDAQIVELPGALHGLIPEQQDMLTNFILFYSKKENQKEC